MSPNRLSFIISSFLSCVLLNTRDQSPFFSEGKKEVLPSTTSSTIGGAEFNYTHISLLLFLLLIMKVPVNQEKGVD